MQNAQQLQQAIRNYIAADDQLRAATAARQQAKEAVLNAFGDRRDTVVINTGDGKLTYGKVSSASSLSKKILDTAVPEFYAEHRLPGDPKEMIAHLWSKRPVTEKWDLTRVIAADD
jgi:Cys-tRNA synthase (O-phospho-L-seryl-tRNA:Cys-tRNA synthase)